MRIDTECEEYDGYADCSVRYNCCDCGGSGCDCPGCWSCNACDHCKNEREEE